MEFSEERLMQNLAILVKYQDHGLQAIENNKKMNAESAVESIQDSNLFENSNEYKISSSVRTTRGWSKLSDQHLKCVGKY